MDDSDNVNKRRYEKPDIKQVDLRPEEAVLAACKASTGQGGGGPSGGNCRRPIACSSLGS